MARIRKHDYIDVDLSPKHIEKLKSGITVHKQLKGYRDRVAISVKHPLDDKIKYHKKMVMQLMKKKRGYSSGSKRGKRRWTAESRAKLSRALKRAHRRKPNWTA